MWFFLGRRRYLLVDAGSAMPRNVVSHGRDHHPLMEAGSTVLRNSFFISSTTTR
ncbi:hypothetical protein [Actinoplanes teichomyceticus]|uniref:hypothetical protein n=1 Tax=Actinoplanes teichomyceticus TaxID=1867 RepID=UPI0013DE77D8|nr:hypothetical protein [Actinoplanes teichomyceticus]